MRRILVWFAMIATITGLGLAPVPATATPGYCGLTWGSLGKSEATMTQAPVFDVRSGRHPCFDRLVIDLGGTTSGYNVFYVSDVTMDGSGSPVGLRGGAFLNVGVLAPAYDGGGNLTYNPWDRSELVNVNGYNTFRQVAWAGTFEGQTTLGLGVRARLPFRAFTLAGPGGNSRLVIDVAHYW